MKIIAKKEFINKVGTPTANCHASTVLPLKNGDVIALGSAEAEYSYPAITCFGTELHITYTYNRVSIVY